MMETFLGYERPDGSVGVRNHVAVIPTVSCANGVVGLISRSVPAVSPLYHGHGCGRAGSDLELHLRTLSNLCRNPNVAAVLVVGLGCEVIKAEVLVSAIAASGKPVEYLNIQKEGGSRRAAARGAEIAGRLLQEAGALKRGAFSLDRLTMGLECGGSDAFSGVTANPAVGLAADWLVRAGGTVVLTENTEMIGAGHILERRASSPEVAEKVAEMVFRAETLTREILGPMASLVIAPGNMDGGMSSIQEKSLGCIIKGGSTPVNQVVDYGRPPDRKGLVLMDGPGYDTESMAGLAATGAQVIVFTTGRGNPIGFPIVPVIKVASTSGLYRAMEDDMDVNAGAVLEGKNLQEVGDEIITLVKRVLDGERTKAEVNDQSGILCLYTTNPSF